MSVELAALEDSSVSVRLAAVVKVSHRAADQDVFAALGPRLDDENLAVIAAAATGFMLYAGPEGLERVLLAYVSSDDSSVHTLADAVIEVCWNDPTVDATLRSIAQRSPQDDIALAAVDILSDMWADPALAKKRPPGFVSRIINSLRRA